MDNLEMLKPSKRKRQKRRDKRMDEELIECYRNGWRLGKATGYKKRYENKHQDFEHSRKQEGIKFRSGGGTKYLNDTLGPLKRFLISKEGKSWDGIYSELCQKMDTTTVIGRHLIDHLFGYVELHVEIINGKVYGVGGWRGRYELSYSGCCPRFYVHPKTGCLVRVRKKWREVYTPLPPSRGDL